ncbi:hypothetical protein HPB47_017454 [Ixodes persulcatus]|uniref:Uncharacterized protein n=1 Tax=Ixodes persulcatus TaxID=34615 RepID=A0AC60QNG0_IXOPE|nr:hypothetical protein HPB47_017454 [Ixodes persulcatus]
MGHCPLKNEKRLKSRGRSAFDFRSEKDSGVVICQWYDNRGVIMGSNTHSVNPGSQLQLAGFKLQVAIGLMKAEDATDAELENSWFNPLSNRAWDIPDSVRYDGVNHVPIKVPQQSAPRCKLPTSNRRSRMECRNIMRHFSDSNEHTGSSQFLNIASAPKFDSAARPPEGNTPPAGVSAILRWSQRSPPPAPKEESLVKLVDWAIESGDLQAAEKVLDHLFYVA